MKLCRFELLEKPGEIRSGFVHSGKVYETDGSEAIAVHEAAAIRPLAPIARPPSYRILHLAEHPELYYNYGNPTSVIGPSQIVPKPDFTEKLDYEAYLAAVIVQDCYRLSVEEADNAVLGLTILAMLVARDSETPEKHFGKPFGRSRDFASAIGPVLTTPDEVDDAVLDDTNGRHYGFNVVTRVNSVEMRRGETASLPFTLAQMISMASESCPLRTGDLFALGPITQPADDGYLTPGDELQVSIERLGTLSLKIGM